MQEPDGLRREDKVKFWGWWNADGPGSLYALTELTKMGIRVSPTHAKPGDFANINWSKSGGHSVVFLGWEKTAEGEPALKYWSSQASTNGFGTVTVPFSRISGVVFTRLTNPERILEVDPELQIFPPRPVYDVLEPKLLKFGKPHRTMPIPLPPIFLQN
jgi:hypothetical protein